MTREHRDTNDDDSDAAERSERADELEREIEELETDGGAAGGEKRRPGESPNEYVERRGRAIRRKPSPD